MDEIEKESWIICLKQWKLLSGDWFLNVYDRNKRIIDLKEEALKEIGVKSVFNHGCIMCKNYIDSDQKCPLGNCRKDYHYTEWEKFLFEYYDFYDDIIYDNNYGYLELEEKYEIVKLARKFYHELILKFIYRCSL